MVSRLSRSLGVLVVLISFVLPTATVTDAAQAGFPLTANTAFCDPGYLGPFVDCTPWERVVVSFTAVDQEFATTCVTVPGERTASCTVEVPFGATVIAAIDPGIVPPGYALEGPSALEIVVPDGPPEGAFGGPSFVLLPVLNEPPIEAPPVIEEQPAAGGFPLSANAAYCEPGYLGPFVDCEPWAGVTVSFATTDGAFTTACVTSGAERAAGCVVEVPFGSTVVASIDLGVVPAGYVLEGPPSMEIVIPDGPPEGEFGGAVFVLLPASGDTTVTPPVTGSTDVIVAPGTDGLPAGLYTGSCADLQPGDAGKPVAALTSPRLPTGERVGAADAVQVATSFTALSVPFEQVVDGTHVVAAFDAADPDTVVACGAIGGALDDNGALTVGLRPVAGMAGVAYISPGDNGSTVVSLFVADLMGNGVQPTAASTEPAADTPTGVGVSQQELVPSGEGTAQIQVNYFGCPLTADLNGDADALTASCTLVAPAVTFYVLQDSKILSQASSPAAPSSVYMTGVPPVEVRLLSEPIDANQAVFCKGSTPTYTMLPYGRVKLTVDGIPLKLIDNEVVQCDWFMTYPAGLVLAEKHNCPSGYDPANKTLETLRAECNDKVDPPLNFRVTSGTYDKTLPTVYEQYMATDPPGGPGAIFLGVPVGMVTIVETVPAGYELVSVFCKMEVRGPWSPWTAAAYDAGTITNGNSVSEEVLGGHNLQCVFVNVPVSGGVAGDNAVAAMIAPGPETRSRSLQRSAGSS